MRKNDSSFHVFQDINCCTENLIDEFFSNFDCQETFQQKKFQAKENVCTGLIS